MRSALIALCLLFAHVGLVHAQANEPVLSTEAAEAARPMPPEVKARLFFAGLGGGVLASGISAGLGAIFLGGCDEGDSDCQLVGSFAFLIVGGTSAMIGVPLLTASFVKLAGDAKRYRGRMGHALLGSFMGSLVGVGAAVLTYRGLSSIDGVSDVAAGLSGLGAGLVLSSGISSAAYWASDRKRAERLGLTPAVAPTSGGLTLGLAGRF